MTISFVTDISERIVIVCAGGVEPVIELVRVSLDTEKQDARCGSGEL